MWESIPPMDAKLPSLYLPRWRQLRSYDHFSNIFVRALIFFWTLTILASVLPQETVLMQSWVTRSSSPETCKSRETTCGFVGNGDIYGLGIRLGIYLQVFASITANHLHLPQRYDLVVTYLLFSFALLIALLVITFQAVCTYLVEIIILLFILLDGMIIVMIDFGPMHFAVKKGEHAITPPRTMFICFFGLVIATSIYGAWFWVSIAAGKMTDFFPTPCGTTFFLYAKVTEDHFLPASIYWSFVFIVSTIFLAPLPILVVVDGWNAEIGAAHPGNPPQKSSAFKSWLLSKFSALPSKLTWSWEFDETPQVFMIALLVYVSVFILLCIELPLTWNNVSEINSVSSTGQLIPLVVGILGFVQIGWSVHKQRKSKHQNVANGEDVEMSSHLLYVEPMQGPDGHWR